MRRTQISEGALMAIFEGKKVQLPFTQGCEEAPIVPPRFNTVASQCELDSAYMDLCDVLIRSQQTGVLTTQHAKERKAVQLWAQKLLLDVRLEEKYQRDRVMGERRDHLELMRTMLLALAPSSQLGQAANAAKLSKAVKIRGSTQPGELSPSLRMSTSLQSLTPNATTNSVAPLMLLQPGGMGIAPNLSEIERLQERVAELERQLAHKMKLDWLVAPHAGTMAVISKLPRDMEQETRDMTAAIVRLEQLERDSLAGQESDTFGSLIASKRLAQAERLLVEQRRYLVHTPYEAFRPRIPLQHSLKGEDFLRRWLMAEIFKHFEDLMGQLQVSENSIRCEIEDEAFGTLPLVRANAFEPMYRIRCESLEEEAVELRYHKVVHERDASAHATEAKIKLLLETEERARGQTAFYERLDCERIAEVASAVALLKDVQKTVVSLRGELQRATVRHREELLSQHQHLTALDTVARSHREQESADRLAAYNQTAFASGTGTLLHETLSSTTVALRPVPPSNVAGDAKKGLANKPTPRKPNSQRQQAMKDVYLQPAARTGAKNPQGSTSYWAGF
eukprot:GILI01029542.1.p1 GENE.GILI01029542.1~~GILI01029542.1.p1  ORF type:complete len:577 (+),score=103.21 GILI01029542.1:39-1733(+)